MLRVEASDTAATDAPKSKNDYAAESLPLFLNEDWWNTHGEADPETAQTTPLSGHWAHLDLQMAYPSLSLDYLDTVLPAYAEPTTVTQDQLFLGPFGSSDSKAFSALAGYPIVISQPLSRPGIRIKIAKMLMRHLSEVEYEPVPYAEDNNVQKFLWLPPHAPDLPINKGKHRCIPTGLCISGLLLNTALISMDARMARWMENQREIGHPSAFLRFADDMILLAKGPYELATGIDSLWEGLSRPLNQAGVHTAFLSNPEASSSSTNLRVNWSKVEPKPLAGLMNLYLKDQKWRTCDGCRKPATPPVPQAEQQMHFHDWLQYRDEEVKLGLRSKSDTAEYTSYRRELNEFAIRPDRLDPFLTYLVERLSALGRDTLKTRFGSNAHDHLVQLHELVRFGFHDGQVREETRLSFAANRLARAWLAERNPDEDRLHIQQIRRSIQAALSKAPWKFSLWRAVIQAAARRPPGNANSFDEEQARTWLLQTIAPIAFGEAIDSNNDPEVSLLWEDDYNCEGCWDYHNSEISTSPDPKALSRARRRLTLSYLRAAFWRALTQTVRDLGNLKNNLERQSPTEQPAVEWSSNSWTFRALAERDIQPTLSCLSKIDDWATILYPPAQQRLAIRSLSDWWWEREALATALIACQSQKDSISTLTSNFISELTTDTLNETLAISNSLLDEEDPATGYTASLLATSQSQSGSANSIAPSMWSTVPLGTHDTQYNEKLAKAIADTNMTTSKIVNWEEASLQIGFVHALRISEYLPLTYIDSITAAQEENPYWWKSAPTGMGQLRSLELYGHVRSLALSVGRRLHLKQLRREMGLHNLLWSIPKNDNYPEGRRLPLVWSHPPSPDAPVLGLPARVALAMLKDAVESVIEERLEERPSDPSVWLLHKSGRKAAVLGRMSQLGLRNLTADDLHHATSVKHWIYVSRDPNDWSVQPHPAFFLPQALGILKPNNKTFDLWCHLLLFYTAIEGSERFLDSLIKRGPGAIPFKERWDLRGRLPLDVEIWEVLDELIRLCGFHKANDKHALSLAYRLKESLDRLTDEPPVSIHDFRWERVDVRLDLTKSLEVPQAILPFAHGHKAPKSMEDFKIDETTLASNISVRIGQIKAEPRWQDLIYRFPVLNRSEIQVIMSEACAALFSEDTTDKSSITNPTVVIFPEVTIPRSEITTIQRIVGERSIAVFCGLMWRVIPSLTKVHHSVNRGRKFFINEGLLSVPLRLGDDNGPPLVRNFIIEKPAPSAIEHGLAKFLSKSFKGVTDAEWKVIPGRRWFRFLHPSWGDFSVAICSDLLDASPWVALRGEIMHLFMCAYNPDVELYEALTWVRAYENYVNMVSVNHGHPGGSFAWSPQHGEKKEVAKLRGGDLFLTADIAIPVKQLWIQQKRGLKEAIDHQAEKWFNMRAEKDPKKPRFKTPPLEFPSRNETE